MGIESPERACTGIGTGCPDCGRLRHGKPQIVYACTKNGVQVPNAQRNRIGLDYGWPKWPPPFLIGSDGLGDISYIKDVYIIRRK
jgi:hypothetical protein